MLAFSVTVAVRLAELQPAGEDRGEERDGQARCRWGRCTHRLTGPDAYCCQAIGRTRRQTSRVGSPASVIPYYYYHRITNSAGAI
jgi:hypothetical protein